MVDRIDTHIHTHDELDADELAPRRSSGLKTSSRVPTHDQRVRPRLRSQHHRPGGVRPVGSTRRSHRPLLIAGPPAGVAGRLQVSCQVDPSTHSLGIGI